MPLDPVTAALQLGGDVVTGAVQAVGDYISTTQLRRLDEAQSKAQDDVEAFKQALLARDIDGVNLRLGGLQSGIRVNASDAECEELKSFSSDLDAWGLLGLYCRARGADLAAERNQILKDTASVPSGGK